MNNLLKKKGELISLLQKNNGWGKNKEDVRNLLDVLDIEESDLEDSKAKPQTRLLIDTNRLKSSFELDHQIELPIVELFIDNSNFVVFTTRGIYNCRVGIIKQIEYSDITGVDENSINGVFCDSPKNLHLFDIKLIVKNGKEIPITIEYGISFRPIVYFLIIVNKKKI